MSRTKKGARDSRPSQTASKTKGVDKQHRKLLAKAGKSIREVRHEVAQLKKAGVVAKRIDVPRYVPSRYMLNKITRNADILSGRATTVAPKTRAERENIRRYVEAGIYEKRGSVLVIPTERASDKARIRRGAIEISRSLRNGEMRQLILPYQVKDMAGLAARLKDDPSLGGMKEPDEFFAFYLGRGSSRAFVDEEELIEEIEIRYAHLFKGNTNREAFKHFMLIRFKPSDELRVPEAPDNIEPWTGGSKARRRKYHRTGRNDGPLGTYERHKLERDANRKANKREAETEAQRQKRLDYQRKYEQRKRDNRGKK